MSPLPPTRTSGRFLTFLPRELEDRLVSMSEPVTFAANQRMQRPGAAVRYGYVLEAGLVTQSLPLPDGRSLETGMMGSGSLVGASALLTDSPSVCAVHARSAVRAWRAPIERLREAVAASDDVRHLVMAYVAATLEGAYEVVACTARHSVEQRLARWIVVASHHVGGDPIRVTHDALGEHLCVRRATVTTALHRLEGDHAIYAARGAIWVRDAAVLERCSCGCHRVVRLGRCCDTAEAIAGPPPNAHSTPIRSSSTPFGKGIQGVGGANAMPPPRQGSSDVFGARRLVLPRHGTLPRTTTLPAERNTTCAPWF